MKRCAIITYENGIYELPHELPNDLRLRTLAFHIFFLIEYICFHHSGFTHYHLVTKTPYSQTSTSAQRRQGSELSSYELELRNQITQNDVTLRVTNSKIFVEIHVSSYQLEFIKY